MLLMHFGKARRYDYLTVRRCVFQNQKNSHMGSYRMQGFAIV